MAKYKKSEKVQWKNLGQMIEGQVEEIYTEVTTRTFKGKAVTRNGSRGNPAYVVKSATGDQALMLESDLQKAKA